MSQENVEIVRRIVRAFEERDRATATEALDPRAFRGRLAADTKGVRLRAKTRHRKGLALATVVACLASGSAADARTFEPTRKDDPSPNKCKPNNCSLREALLAANERDGRDLVLLRGGAPYEMELPRSSGGGEDGFFWSYGSTIRGRGPGKTKIDANGLDTVMQLGNENESNTLRALRVTGGLSSSSAGGILGTGGRLTLRNVVVENNVSQAGSGGGARLEPAIELRIIDSRFLANDGDFGGGLYLAPGSAGGPTAFVRGSTIRDNQAIQGGGLYGGLANVTIRQSTIDDNSANSGAGIYMRARSEKNVTTLRSSTVSRNLAHAGGGGGVYLDGADSGEDPELITENATIAGNDATVSGGGISTIQGAVATIDNSTIAYNMADLDDIGGGFGGGLHQSTGGAVTVTDSVIAKNTSWDSGGAATPQCFGAFTASSVVIEEPLPSCTGFDEPPNNQVTDAAVGPLQDNGGPTETVALLSDSPAIGFSNSANGCPERDQRGKLRPEDCDGGAFERKGP